MATPPRTTMRMAGTGMGPQHEDPVDLGADIRSERSLAEVGANIHRQVATQVGEPGVHLRGH